MNPLISVITPAYNHEKFIAGCIESVLAQRYSNWEMIIVDDGSTDRTPYIIEQYARLDSRIKFIRHQTNWGVSRLAETHNQALGITNGEYITVIEGDDLCSKDRFEIQIQSFYEKDIVLSHGLVTCLINNQLIDYPYEFSDDIKYNYPIGSALKSFLLGRIPLSAQSVMVRKDALMKINGFKQIPSLYLVDFPTWMEIALLGKFVFIDRPLGYWRRHGSSITTIYLQNIHLGVIEYIKVFIEKNYSLINSLSINLEDYIKYYGYYAFFNLFKTYLYNKNFNKARTIYKEVFKRRKIIKDKKEYFKFLLLTLNVYFPYLPLYNLYKMLGKIYSRKYIKRE